MTRFNLHLFKSGKHLLYCGTVCAGILIVSACKKHDNPQTMPPVRVSIETLGKNGISGPDRSYSGTVESADVSTLSFPVPGTIQEIYVKSGQRVTKGQVLARVKSESLVNSRNIAQAELDEARDGYRRLKMLHDANALPDVKWVEIQSKLKQAENAAALANRAVSDATLRAPISGYISEKLADAGQTVLAAEPVLKMVNLNDLQMSISVPEEEISSFGEGQTAEITLDALDSLKIMGTIGQKAVVADPFTRSYTVKFNIPNSNGKILPGMIGNLVVRHSSSDDENTDYKSFTLPSQAVLLDADNRRFVWIVKNGRAARRFVEASELATDGVKVDSGLTEGDSVIVAGMQKVSTGTPVVAVN